MQTRTFIPLSSLPVLLLVDSPVLTLTFSRYLEKVLSNGHLFHVQVWMDTASSTSNRPSYVLLLS